MAPKEPNSQDSKHPETNEVEIDGSKPRRRGRPPFVFSAETERRLLRLFLLSCVSLERISRIVAMLGGPNRLSLRACLEKLTGAGRDTGLDLRDVRPQNGEEQVRITTEDTVEEQVATQQRCSKCAVAEQELVALEAQKFDARESTPIRPASLAETCGNKVFRWTSIALGLDGGRPGLFFHLVNCCSISKPTTASRTSSTSSECDIHTVDSEYQQYYADIQPDGSPSTPFIRDGNVPSWESTGTGAPSLHGADPLVVHILLDAHLHKRADEDIARSLRMELAKEENATRQDLINHADRRGVTALHLCVAYGLEKTCGLLLEKEADSGVRTAKGTCISHFAKPAERLAGATDRFLYYRIMHCRKYVEQGKIPPVPPSKPRPEPKKRKSVHELTSPSPAANRTDDTELGRKRARAASSSPSGAPQSRSQIDMTANDDGIDQVPGVEPQFAEGFCFSPANTFHYSPSTTDIQNFAKDTSLRRGLLHRNMHNWALPPFPGDVHAANGLHSFDSGFMIDFNGFRAPQHVHTAQEQDSPANLNNDVDSRISPAAECVQGTEADWPLDIATHTVSTAEAIPFEPLPLLQRTTGAQQAPEPATQTHSVLQGAQQRNAQDNPDRRQPIYNQPMTDISRDVFGLPTSQPGSENDDLATIPMDLQPTFLYCHCIHGYPRNYERTYCLLGCSSLLTGLE